MSYYRTPLKAYFTDEELAAPSLVFPKDRKKKKVPGECAKCGKHIGRGVAFHEKACKG